MYVLLSNNRLPLAGIMIKLLLQVRHSNMKVNARQPLFPLPLLSPHMKIETPSLELRGFFY